MSRHCDGRVRTSPRKLSLVRINNASPPAVGHSLHGKGYHTYSTLPYIIYREFLIADSLYDTGLRALRKIRLIEILPRRTTLWDGFA